MGTLLIANNCTVESGSFMGDQLCMLKVAYLFAENTPNINHIIMTCSPGNQLDFLWAKFIRTHNVQIIHDNFDAGNWPQRHSAWDKWRTERRINNVAFDSYKELYLRIHGCQRQNLICGSERGLGRRNIYSYWWCGQEGSPDELPAEVDWFDNTLIDHPHHQPVRDVYISPHAKTQGNYVFTFDFWSEVCHRLVDAGISVTCGWDNPHFCHDLVGNPLFQRHWGGHREWMAQVCQHRLVACGNTGTGWLAAACGVPMLTMEPPNSQMPDHRYGRCGLKNIIEIVDTPDATYVARRITEECRRKLVMTTGCYDVLHAGHIRHLEKSRALGTRLVVALNSDRSVRGLKGPDRPINPQDQRKAVLEALRCVDEVRLFDEADAQNLLLELRPDVLTAGFGYTPEKIIGRHFVESWGGHVVVTCPEDAKHRVVSDKNEPSTTKIVERVEASKVYHKFCAEVVDICKLAQGYSVNGFDKLKLLADQFMMVKELSGDVADLGTYRGGTALVLKKLAPDKHLHLFDTWAGTPYDDPLCHHKKGGWTASLEECQAIVGSDNFTHYYPGVLPQSITEAPQDGRRHIPEECSPLRFCFVYVDMDTYQATKDAIAFFWERMVSGGRMVFDDYMWEPCAGVEKAIAEAFANDKVTVLPSLHTCIVEKP